MIHFYDFLLFSESMLPIETLLDAILFLDRDQLELLQLTASHFGSIVRAYETQLALRSLQTVSIGKMTTYVRSMYLILSINWTSFSQLHGFTSDGKSANSGLST